MSNNNGLSPLKIMLPLLFAVVLCIGIIIGNFFALRSSKTILGGLKKGSFNKIDALLTLIDRDYVDTVDMHDLIEEAMPAILDQLDPHSVYMPVSVFQTASEDLGGSFSGIGIQFNIQQDTIMIVAVISGGPSEKLGIQAGDRIVQVNDSIFVGEKITEDYVLKKLRGKKGTTVKLGIKRNGTNEILQYDIIRGDVPLYSIDVAYLIDGKTGYIKVSKFSATTYKEFTEALARLRAEGATQMILDFRGNTGGYLDIVIDMVNEFLPQNGLIVYTEGRRSERINYYANGKGRSQNLKIVVLIDEWSASASEIFAGAIQDNDRGIILGRRSFGKGLVQTTIPFPDSSAIRLTTARYYTPAGRSIQKPYTKGNNNEYENDLLTRYEHGEFDVADSIKLTDSIQYRTLNGRIVYGGGGIMPDIFVPRDTSGISNYYNKLVNHSYIYQYSFEYADKNRNTLKQYKNWEDLTAYLKTQNLIEGITDFAEKKGIRKNIAGIRKSEELIENLSEAYIARIMLGNNGFYPVLNENDLTVQKALETLNQDSIK